MNPDDVLVNLERMADAWSDRDPGATTMTRVIRHQRPVSESRRKAARKKIVRRSVIAAAFSVLILIVGSVVSTGRLSIDPEREAAAQQLALEARIPYSLDFGSKATCNTSSFREYLETFTEGTEEHAKIGIAARCLVQLEDPRAVAPLLELLRPAESVRSNGSNEDFYAVPISLEEVLSILVPLGENGHRELQEALVDPDERIRLTAARALAANGSDRAIMALVESAEDREPVVRIAVSHTLETIVTTGITSKEQAFEVFKLMAEDTYPEVRANVAISLGIFRGSRPHRLLETLAEDLDPEVRLAAEASLVEFR